MGSKRNSREASESRTASIDSAYPVNPRRIRSHSLDLLIRKLSTGASKLDDKLTDILSTVGEFGPFQQRLVALTFIPSILSAFFLHADNFVFTIQQPYCNTSWLLAFYPNLTVSQLMHMTLPKDDKGEFLTCLMFSPDFIKTKVTSQSNINDTQPCQEGWIYPKAKRRSLISEAHPWASVMGGVRGAALRGGSWPIPVHHPQFDLVCGKESHIDSVHTMLLAGVLIGSIVFGISSDKLGRYTTFLMSLLGLTVFGFGTAFVSTFHQYLFFRFCVCQAVMGYIISSLSLATEWLVNHHLIHAVVLKFCFFSVGSIYLAGLAHMLPHWRLLFLIGSMPVFLLLFYIWFLPKSPRWLMVRGKVDEAKKVLHQAALVNGTVIPETLMMKLHLPRKPGASGSIMDFYNCNYLRKVILVLLCAWFSISFNYFTMILKMNDLTMNKYLTFLISGLMKVPAQLSCIILLEKIGRKLSLGIMFTQGCLLSILILIIPSESKTTLLLLLFIGQLLQATTITVFFIYSSELLPTVLRATGLGLVMLAFVTGAIAAIMLLSLLIGSLLPNFLCCCFSFLSLSVSCMLPDVQNQPYDFLEHLPEYNVANSLFSTNFYRSSSLDSDDSIIDDMSEEVLKNTFFNAIMWQFSQRDLG
ncbi:solute carrier family 22 member 14 [Sorex fumeus]|uniref:solute carrier family 22 member 14 n=1 Tax=Sorex fumeus TaxID=62283 RepID=UPI0024ACC415|nr:solute carrier family 22 member 14 [Sorex fumeus]